MQLLDPIDVDLTLAFVAVARPCKIDWYYFALHDLFPYECMTGKLSRVCGSAPMVCRLADGIEEIVDGTQSIRAI